MKPGDILDGRYEITDRLGAGGMGEVYKATHTFLGSPRVIKVVHPHISTNTDARERFLREARAATKIQHPNVATLHDFASLPDGAHYMVWEYIDGENLAQRLRTHRTLPPRQAVRIAIQALRGLEAIHRAGIIHRDISPENLMITRDDEVKVIDLGVAKLEDPDAVSQTRTGIFVGKLRYASPEQLGFLPEGERVDARADLYALAMVLVELLTGRPPYEAKSPHEYFLLHAREAKARTVELPAELPGGAALEAVLEKALSRDRNQRYASARELVLALEEIERTLPEARDMPTLATPLDGDETMRVTPSPVATNVDTLHRETLRTADATVRTPLPAAQGQKTVLTGPAPAAPQQKIRKGVNPVYFVAFIAVVTLVIGALLFWPQAREREPIVSARPASTTPAPQPAPLPAATTASVAPEPTLSAPPQVASASVTVTSAPAPATTTPALAPPPAVVEEQQPVAQPAKPKPAPPRAVTPQPKPVETAEAEPEEEPRPSTRDAFSSVPTYVDGSDDDAANERALVALRRELRGTSRVALRAGGMQVALARELRQHFPNIEFAPHADLVIRFDGTLERLGRGRKRRAAVGTVEKNGRIVFRYELPDEVFRVGASPTEAFADVLAKAAP